MKVKIELTVKEGSVPRNFVERIKDLLNAAFFEVIDDGELDFVVEEEGE